MAESSRPRRTPLLIGVVLVSSCLLPYGWISWARAAAERAYQEQLALARKEGIPTTTEEFAALMPPVAPEENAALHYKKLEGLSFDFTTSNNLQFKLVREPSPELLEQANKFLATHQQTLEHLDAATSLAKCRFDRDWSKVGFVRSQGGSAAHSSSHLLKLRGTYRMLKGDAQGAIADADRIGQMADHFGQEPSPSAQHIRDNLEDDVLEALADWSYARRGDPIFLDALNERIDRYSQNAKKSPVWASWLVDGAYILDRIWTASGRTELNIKSTTFGQQVRLALAPVDTKARIMEGLRELTTAAKLAQPDRSLKMKAARQRVREAAKPLDGLVYVLPLETSQDLFESRRLYFRALARAFKHRDIPATLDTSDLIHPSTGRPITYSFDGLVISVESTSLEQFVVKQASPPVR